MAGFREKGVKVSQGHELKHCIVEEGMRVVILLMIWLVSITKRAMNVNNQQHLADILIFVVRIQECKSVHQCFKCQNCGRKTFMLHERSLRIQVTIINASALKMLHSRIKCDQRRKLRQLPSGTEVQSGGGNHKNLLQASKTNKELGYHFQNCYRSSFADSEQSNQLRGQAGVWEIPKRSYISLNPELLDLICIIQKS